MISHALTQDYASRFQENHYFLTIVEKLFGADGGVKAAEGVQGAVHN